MKKPRRGGAVDGLFYGLLAVTAVRVLPLLLQGPRFQGPR